RGGDRPRVALPRPPPATRPSPSAPPPRPLPPRQISALDHNLVGALRQVHPPVAVLACLIYSTCEPKSGCSSRQPPARHRTRPPRHLSPWHVAGRRSGFCADSSARSSPCRSPRSSRSMVTSLAG